MGTTPRIYRVLQTHKVLRAQCCQRGWFSPPVVIVPEVNPAEAFIPGGRSPTSGSWGSIHKCEMEVVWNSAAAGFQVPFLKLKSTLWL